jgi:peptidyl-dipeptidase A
MRSLAVKLALSVASLALLSACADTKMAKVAEPISTSFVDASSPQAPTAEEASAYVRAAEKALAEQSEYTGRVNWVRNTFITFDTMWLEAKANAEFTKLQVRLASGAARFNDTTVDEATRRKLNLLKLSITLPVADRAGAADELAAIGTRLDSTYATGKFSYKGKTYTLDEASNLLATSRDPVVLRAMWEGWRTVSVPMAKDYSRLIALSNEGSVALGYKDTGALWRSGYDMEPDAFAAETDRLWAQVAPFYKNLHCYVRAQLNQRYGDNIQSQKGPIRADLLGNMWSQDWSNIYDVVAPKKAAKTKSLSLAGLNLGNLNFGKSTYSLTNLLKAKNYDATRIIKTSEGFYTSIGLPALPDTFWERSQIIRPRDREVVCHASAWDLDNADDVRIKMCTEINGEDFYTAHHELGHNYYQRAYKDQPYLFKNGAHDGFHEAIGDFIGLSSVTPVYLNQVGLLDKVPSESEDLPFLMKMALQKIAFLPFSVMVDRWRWEVYSGQIEPSQYNERWWQLAKQYQGITPPGIRPQDAFDPGAKYHIPASVPYTRYFLAHILQFQFQKAACDQIGWKGALHRCSIYNERAVGAKLNAMLEMGASKPWPEAMQAFTGQREMDGSAMVAYFAPLNMWLQTQNKGRDCGW